MTASAEENTPVFTSTAPANEAAFASRDWALFCSVSLIWGASFLLIAESLEGFTPGVVTLVRVGFGALTLQMLRRVFEPDGRIAVADRVRVFTLAMVWVAIPFTLFPIAQQWVNSAVAGLLNGATPVFVALVALVFLRNRPNVWQIVGLIAGFTGVALISLSSSADGGSQAQGVVLLLLATVCYGFALNMTPPLQARYGALTLMSSVLSFATVAVVPYALVDLGDNQLTWQPAIANVVLGVAGTGVAYWIMANLVGRVGSLRASFITYLVPLVALVLGISLRGDEVGALALIGAPLTLAGAFLASRRHR